MAEEAAELALEGISAGVDKVPDRHWDKIPGLKPKEKDRLKSNNEKDRDRKKKDGSRKSRHRSPSGSDSGRSSGGREPSRAQHRTRDARSSYNDGPYINDNHDRAYYDYAPPSSNTMGDSYYPPPPQSDYPRRYNPQDYQPRNDENQQPRGGDEYNNYAAQSYGREQYAPVRSFVSLTLDNCSLTEVFQDILP